MRSAHVSEEGEVGPVRSGSSRLTVEEPFGTATATSQDRNHHAATAESRSDSLIALITTTGLALVAVGPAAHATVTPRTLSQASDTVTENHTTICTKDGEQAPSSWFRRFSLSEELEDDQAFSVNSVSFGAEAFCPLVGAHVRVINYPKDEPLTWAGLQAAPPPVVKPWPAPRCSRRAAAM